MKKIALALICCVVFFETLDLNGQQFDEQSASRFPNPTLSEYTNQFTIGDIDNDGDLDLILANGRGFGGMQGILPQRIYINDGTGVFSDESSTRLNFSGWARGVELGDIDDDGDLDMIFCQDYNMLPRLFENNGSGFFSDVTPTQLPNTSLSCSRAQFGDLDNDGDLDLYLNNGGTSRFGCGQHRIYLNDGNGNFSDETTALHPLGNLCEPMDVTLGDIDGDFDIDVRTASTANNQSRLLVNDGTGLMTFVSGVPADNNCYSYDFGDIDGDGDLDMIGINAGPNSTELLLENDGAGGFTNISSQISPNPTLDDNDSKFFDYDNDGDLDLIVARIGFGGERVYNNDGLGNFTQDTTAIDIFQDATLDVMVADLNGNGRLDIVTAQGESGSFINRIYINNGPVDTIPPRIVATEELDNVSQSGPYVIRAAILDDMTSDRNFFDTGIALRYSVNGGTELEVAMKHSGGQIYRGEIPQQAMGSMIDYYVVASDFAGNTGMGPVVTLEIEGASDVVADELQLFRGVLIEGDLTRLAQSDDEYFIAQPGFTLSAMESPVWIDLTGVSTFTNPSSLGFSIESAANTPNIRQVIELFNYSTNEFEVVDDRLTSFSTDASATVQLDQDMENFVESATGEVETRVGWRQNGFVLLFPWEVRIDRAVWLIGE